MVKFISSSGWMVSLSALIFISLVVASNPSGENLLGDIQSLFQQWFPDVPAPDRRLRSPDIQQEATNIVDSYAWRKKSTPGVFVVQDTVPWKLDIQLTKRGPSCMQKCIAQGILHPVQCHSLC